MADLAVLSRFGDLLNAGYFPSVGAWAQVDPGQGLSTVLNAFNTLGPQSLELFFFDQAGNRVGSDVALTVGTNQARRWDLETLLPAGSLPFEGSLWAWCRGDTSEGNLGLQAIDLDFTDRNRPDNYVLATVHLIFDFLDTLGIPPYLDLLCPRIPVDQTPEGAPRYQCFLGMAHSPTSASDLQGGEIELSISNHAGEVLAGNQTIPLPLLGSWYGDLAVIFPDLPDFLPPSGLKRGYGVLSIREAQARRVGMCAMVKVVDRVSGAMLVDHCTDRSFARPAMKDPG